MHPKFVHAYLSTYTHDTPLDKQLIEETGISMRGKEKQQIELSSDLRI